VRPQLPFRFSRLAVRPWSFRQRLNRDRARSGLLDTRCVTPGSKPRSKLAPASHKKHRGLASCSLFCALFSANAFGSVVLLRNSADGRVHTVLLEVVC
jgi:hypothetical protein